MDSQLKTTAEKLRHYRESCALSHRQVADALGVERSTYTKYETGKSEPNLYTLMKLAAIYNVSPEMLLPDMEPDDEKLRHMRDASLFDSPIYQLSKDERGLVALFRALSREDKQEAMELMANLSKKAGRNSSK